MSRALACALVIGALVGACASDGAGAGSTTGGGVCPSDLPASCPDPAPSYAADVAPLLSRHCLKCHAAGGVAGANPLDGYAQVYGERTTVLTRVYACQMPPATEPPLSSAERRALLAWLVCGAPDN